MKQQGITVVDILIHDYLVLEKRSHVPVNERMVVEFGELRDYVYALAREVGMETAKEMAAALAGKEMVDMSMSAAGAPEEGYTPSLGEGATGTMVAPEISITAAREAIPVSEDAKDVGRRKAKEVGLALAGGKGLSLSIMSRIVDVPRGRT